MAMRKANMKLGVRHARTTTHIYTDPIPGAHTGGRSRSWRMLKPRGTAPAPPPARTPGPQQPRSTPTPTTHVTEPTPHSVKTPATMSR